MEPIGTSLGHFREITVISRKWPSDVPIGMEHRSAIPNFRQRSFARVNWFPVVICDVVDYHVINSERSEITTGNQFIACGDAENYG
jgi:hypothetical protein